MSQDFRLNRLLSQPLTSLLLKTPVTPNQVTFLSLFFGVLAGCLFSTALWPYELLAALSYQFAVVLDNCDGEIARAKNMRSSFGAWLDIAVDFCIDLVLFSGLAVAVAKKGYPGPVALFLFLCLSGTSIHFALVVLEKLKGFGPAAFGAPHPDHKTRRNFFLTAFDALREGEASWLVLLLVLTHRTEYLLWFGGIYMQLIWMSGLFVNFKWLFLKASHENR